MILRAPPHWGIFRAEIQARPARTWRETNVPPTTSPQPA